MDRRRILRSVIWVVAAAALGRRLHAAALQSGAREIRIGDSRCPDVVDFGAIEPPSGSIRGRDRYRKYVSWLVAGARFELYSRFAILMPVVPASVVAPE
jgi:hypothetical protein